MGGIVTKISPLNDCDSGEFEDDQCRVNFFTGTPKYRKMEDELLDPRSATLEIKRTPIWLPFRKSQESTPVTTRNLNCRNELKAMISDDSALDVGGELMSLDNSVNNGSIGPQPLSQSPVMEELREKLKIIKVSPDVRAENVSTPENVTAPLRKNKFFTPDPKNLLQASSPLTKERTPLATVNSNIFHGQLGGSGGKGKGKSWRAPEEERARRCLPLQNTPPLRLLPPFGSPRSVPAKRIL